MKPVLGYWNIRGLAEPVRYLLHYLGVDFEDKRYDFGSEPNYFDCEWTRKDKEKLGLDFPKIPYYIDDDVKITQSVVIMRYLSRKHGGMFMPDPNNSKQVLKLEMVEDHVRDIIFEMDFLAYDANFEDDREFSGQRTKYHMAGASKHLGTKLWLFGEKISHVDFLLYEALDVSRYYHGNMIKEFDNLVRFKKRFAALPGVKEYLKVSPKWPLQTPFAKFGFKGDPPKLED